MTAPAPSTRRVDRGGRGLVVALALHQFRYDLRAFLRNRQSRFFTLALPVLFLVIFAQIWHAAVDRAQTWVWWASGIVLGALILAVFALFEKRRNDVLKMIDEIKHWK